MTARLLIYSKIVIALSAAMGDRDHEYSAVGNWEEKENFSRSSVSAPNAAVISTDDDYQFNLGESSLIDPPTSAKSSRSMGFLISSTLDSPEQPLFGDIVDGDLTEHDEVLNAVFTQSKEAARQHLNQVKQRLLSESLTSSQNCELHHLRLIELKNNEIETLREQLKAAEGIRDSLSAKFEVLKENCINKFASSRQHINTEFSVFKVFNCWKQLVVDRKNECLLEKFAVIMRRRTLLSQSFARIHRENSLQKMSKLKLDHQVAIDRVTKQVTSINFIDGGSHFAGNLDRSMAEGCLLIFATNQVVEAYEGDLNRLRMEAAEAHTASRHEQLRRRQLEEDLRRMILKNMTAMNFEALSLFQHTTVTSPLQQQQTMEVLKDMVSSTADISCIEAESRSDAPRGDQVASRAPALSSSLSRSHMGECEGSSDDLLGEEAPRRSQPTPLPTPSTTGRAFYDPPHRDLSLVDSQRQCPESMGTSRRSRGTSGVGLRPPLLPQKDKGKEIFSSRSGDSRFSKIP